MTPAAQIILQTILNVLLLLAAFAKSYFNEKSKNLATKEDISEITQQVEDVKNSLQFRNQMRLSLRIEEKNAIVICYEKAQSLLNKSKVKYFSFDKDNYSELDKVLVELDALYDEFILSQSKLEFYVQNKDVVDSSNKVAQSLLDLHVEAGKEVLNYKQCLLKHKRRLKEVATEEEVDAAYKQHQEELAEIMTDKNTSLYEEAAQEIISFRIHSYAHLLTIERN